MKLFTQKIADQLEPGQLALLQQFTSWSISSICTRHQSI
jgi:hypothetical protein